MNICDVTHAQFYPCQRFIRQRHACTAFAPIAAIPISMPLVFQFMCFANRILGSMVVPMWSEKVRDILGLAFVNNQNANLLRYKSIKSTNILELMRYTKSHSHEYAICYKFGARNGKDVYDCDDSNSNFWRQTKDNIPDHEQKHLFYSIAAIQCSIQQHTCVEWLAVERWKKRKYCNETHRFTSNKLLWPNMFFFCWSEWFVFAFVDCVCWVIINIGFKW